MTDIDSLDGTPFDFDMSKSIEACAAIVEGVQAQTEPLSPEFDWAVLAHLMAAVQLLENRGVPPVSILELVRMLSASLRYQGALEA